MLALAEKRKKTYGFFQARGYYIYETEFLTLVI